MQLHGTFNAGHCPNDAKIKVAQDMCPMQNFGRNSKTSQCLGATQLIQA